MVYCYCMYFQQPYTTVKGSELTYLVHIFNNVISL